jgi:hypothetical protein
MARIAQMKTGNGICRPPRDKNLFSHAPILAQNHETFPRMVRAIFQD